MDLQGLGTLVAIVTGCVGLVTGGIGVMVTLVRKWEHRNTRVSEEVGRVSEEVGTLSSKITSEVSSLAARVIPALNRADELNREQLRQLEALHRRMDDQDKEISRIDKEQATTAGILQWLKTTGHFRLPEDR